MTSLREPGPVRHSWAVALKLFSCLAKIFVPRKLCFKHTIKTKLFLPKNVFCSLPSLKTWLRAWREPRNWFYDAFSAVLRMRWRTFTSRFLRATLNFSQSTYKTLLAFFFFEDEPETLLNISWWKDNFFSIEQHRWSTERCWPSSSGVEERDWIGVDSEDILREARSAASTHRRAIERARKFLGQLFQHRRFLLGVGGQKRVSAHEARTFSGR